MKIVILDSGYESYESEKQLFEENGFQLSIFPTNVGKRSEKIEFAREAKGILVRHTKIDRQFLSSMKELEAIVRYGVGFDNIDIGACTEFGVKVANVQGYANHSVSDHVLALIFSCSRGLWNTRDQVLNGFGAPPVPDIFELRDKTLGIIGLGRIGSELCRKARPLFKKIIATDPYKPESHFKQLGAINTGLDELLRDSHVISLNCNLTDETRHILNQAAFRKMKNRPVIINTSRGGVIEEAALIESLENNLIHSAGIDVFNNEPTTEAQSGIINHPRTICTGHYAWYSDSSVQELQKRASLNLLKLIKGEFLEDCLNPELL
ncbi:C-terminal binding protein [Bacteroidota bacterium]